MSEKQSPTGLARVKYFGFMEILKVFVVCNDGEWVIGSLQPVPPLFQCQLYGKQLTIYNIIILLHWGQFPGVVSTRLDVWRLTELLGQNGSNSSGGGVHFHHKGNLGIWMTKDGSCAEGGLEFLEGFVGT